VKLAQWFNTFRTKIHDISQVAGTAEQVASASRGTFLFRHSAGPGRRPAKRIKTRKWPQPCRNVVHRATGFGELRLTGGASPPGCRDCPRRWCSSWKSSDPDALDHRIGGQDAAGMGELGAQHREDRAHRGVDRTILPTKPICCLNAPPSRPPRQENRTWLCRGGGTKFRKLAEAHHTATKEIAQMITHHTGWDQRERSRPWRSAASRYRRESTSDRTGPGGNVATNYPHVGGSGIDDHPHRYRSTEQSGATETSIKA